MSIIDMEVKMLDTTIPDKNNRRFNQNIEIDSSKLKTVTPMMRYVSSVDDLPKKAEVGEICITKSGVLKDDVDVYICTKKNRWERCESFAESYNFDDEESLNDDDDFLEGFKDYAKYRPDKDSSS